MFYFLPVLVLCACYLLFLDMKADLRQCIAWDEESYNKQRDVVGILTLTLEQYRNKPKNFGLLTKNLHSGSGQGKSQTIGDLVADMVEEVRTWERQVVSVLGNVFGLSRHRRRNHVKEGSFFVSNVRNILRTKNFALLL